MKRAWLHLAPRKGAVFSSTSASVGGHEGLSLVPGATLLGWAAARLYKAPGIDTFTAFHSGKVRFGNGYPLTHTAQIAYPMPQCWHEKKRTKGGIVDVMEAERKIGEKIGEVRNYLFDAEHDRFKEQAEALRSGFVAADGTIRRPKRGYTAKTAIAEGRRRAAEAQLFGYDHTVPEPYSAFVVLIEADDDVSEELFQRIRQVFAGAELKLGRSAKAEFGGAFDCRVLVGEDDPGERPCAISRPAGTTEITVWCLSDLAFMDEATGTPVLAPEPGHLGLPSGALVPTKSFIATRRYSPFNGHLGARDLERPVIAAGSVLCFKLDQPLATGGADDLETGVGLYRECGLGRVWVNPPCLAHPEPRFDAAMAPRIPVPESGAAAANASWPATIAAERIKVIQSWLAAVTAERDDRGKAWTCYEQWRRELEEELLRNLIAQQHELPSAKQWADAAGACAKHRGNAGGLHDALFGRSGICRNGRDDAWNDRNWAPNAKNERETLAGWLRAKICPPLHEEYREVAEALELVARAMQKVAQDDYASIKDASPNAADKQPQGGA
jgi:hypothetical protein